MSLNIKKINNRVKNRKNLLKSNIEESNFLNNNKDVILLINKYNILENNCELFNIESLNYETFKLNKISNFLLNELNTIFDLDISWEKFILISKILQQYLNFQDNKNLFDNQYLNNLILMLNNDTINNNKKYEIFKIITNLLKYFLNINYEIYLNAENINITINNFFYNSNKYINSKLLDFITIIIENKLSYDIDYNLLLNLIFNMTKIESEYLDLLIIILNYENENLLNWVIEKYKSSNFEILIIEFFKDEKDTYFFKKFIYLYRILFEKQKIYNIIFISNKIISLIMDNITLYNDNCDISSCFLEIIRDLPIEDINEEIIEEFIYMMNYSIKFCEKNLEYEIILTLKEICWNKDLINIDNKFFDILTKFISRINNPNNFKIMLEIVYFIKCNNENFNYNTLHNKQFKDTLFKYSNKDEEIIKLENKILI